MSQTKPVEITPQRAFELLCDQLKKAGPDAQKKVVGYLRHICGKFTPLHIYHNDVNIPDSVKVVTYSRCFNAVMRKQWDLIEAKATPAKRVDPAPDEAIPEQDSPDEQVEKVKPEPVKPEPFKPRVVEVDRDRMSPVARAILDEISPYLPKEEQGQAAIDEDRLKDLIEADMEGRGEQFKKMCEEVFSHQINNGGLPVDRIKELIDEKLSASVTRIEFTTPSGEVGHIDGLMHPQVPQLAAWVRAGVPVWAWGGAGAGKTTMHEQVSAMCGLTPHMFSVDPTLTVSKIMGFRSAGSGEFFEGYAYGPYKSGGLMGADEMDTGDQGVMASTNALIVNEWYTFPNSERVRRHPDFRFIAYANTKGMGAVAGYTARNKLDAATLDRFAVIEVKYDPGLETAIACGSGAPGTPWQPGTAADLDTQKRYVDWVQKVREFVGTSVLVSPRASINGCRALRAGITMAEVVDALVFKLCATDTITRVKDRCGLPY
jgi:hypothetical protein